MNIINPKIKANVPKTAQQQPGTKDQSGPPGGNPELVLLPSKINPKVKRWQNLQEEPEKIKQPGKQEPIETKEPGKKEERPAFKIGDRIAFQTKDQRGTTDFTFGKVQNESDLFYGVIADDGSKHSLPKQAARTLSQAEKIEKPESGKEEKQVADREGKKLKTSQEVDIFEEGKIRGKGILIENGDLWQAVNVGSYVDYVKLGNIYKNATVSMKIGQNLGVINTDGSSDVIHKSDVISVGQGKNSKQIEQYSKRLEHHLKRIEKKLEKLHLDNSSLRKRIKQVAEKKGTTPEAEEKLNQQILKERERRKAVEQKLNDLVIKHALKEERRLRDLATLQQRLKEQKQRVQKRGISEETKTRLQTQVEKYEAQIKELEEKLEFQTSLRQMDKQKLAEIESGRLDYKKQLFDFRKEIEKLTKKDYDRILEEQNREKNKTKYDFSKIDFDSIDLQNAIDVMYDDIPKELRKWRIDEANRLFSKNPKAFFNRMLNYARRVNPESDDLQALTLTYGEKWIRHLPTEEHYLSRVGTFEESGLEDIYNQFAPSEGEIENELEMKNLPVIEKALQDLNLNDKDLSEIKLDSPEYEKLVDKLTNLLLANGSTKTELISEMQKTRMPELEKPEEAKIEEKIPEAFFDPEEPYYPRESDYESLGWHENQKKEWLDLLDEDELNLYYGATRDDSGNFISNYPQMIEENPDITFEDYKEMEPILNAVYAESNHYNEQERVAQSHSEVMATSQILSNRIIKKAGMKSKDQAEIEKLKQKASAKEKEFLDKYLYGIKKAFVWFGNIVFMRKSQTSLFDIPVTSKHARKVTIRQPLHHFPHSDKALLPSRKNPRVRRWQLINPDENILNLFGQPAKSEKEKLIPKIEKEKALAELSKFTEKPKKEELSIDEKKKIKTLKPKMVDLEEFFVETKGNIKITINDAEDAAGLFGYFQKDQPGVFIAGLNSRNGINALELIKGGELYTDSSSLKEMTKLLFESTSKSNSPSCIILERGKDFDDVSLKQKYNILSERLKKLKIVLHDYLIKIDDNVYSATSGRVPYKEKRDIKKEDITEIHKVTVKKDIKQFNMKSIKIKSKEDLIPIYDFMSRSDREKFVVLCLNKNKVIKTINIVHVGSITESLVDIKMAFRPAIFSDSKAVIFLHNHPSEEASPSVEDIDLTKHLIAAGEEIGVTVLDHIIVAGKNKYYSMDKNDLLHISKSLSDILKSHGVRIPKKYKFQNLPISIETPKGKTRSGTDSDGHKWETKMKYDYGYIRLTEGVDGDHLDCYIGPDKKSDTVYIVHQNNPDTGKYDEDKVFLGFNSADQVKKVFLQHYDDPGFWGSMTQMPMKNFKNFIEKKKNKAKPVTFDPKNVVVKKSFYFRGKQVIFKRAA